MRLGVFVDVGCWARAGAPVPIGCGMRVAARVRVEVGSFWSAGEEVASVPEPSVAGPPGNCVAVATAFRVGEDRIAAVGAVGVATGPGVSP